MSTTDYLATAPEDTDTLHLQDEDAPWDEHLVPTMRKHSVPAYEEDLLPALLTDIVVGTPGSTVRNVFVADALANKTCRVVFKPDNRYRLCRNAASSASSKPGPVAEGCHLRLVRWPLMPADQTGAA